MLILLCGLPGAGKTTFAKTLPALRLCPDEWLEQLGVDLFDEQMRERLEGLFWLHAQELLKVGQSVVLEFGFWARSERDEKRAGARTLGVPVKLYYLTAPFDELCQRLEHRDGPVVITREMLEAYTKLFEPPDEEELSLYD